MVGAGAAVQDYGRRTTPDPPLEEGDAAYFSSAGAGQLMLAGDRGAIELRKSLPQMNTDNNDGSLHDQRRSPRDA